MHENDFRSIESLNHNADGIRKYLNRASSSISKNELNKSTSFSIHFSESHI
jgi:hypothetical protein